MVAVTVCFNGAAELPGGNQWDTKARYCGDRCFNGAAGITRRKLTAVSNTWTHVTELQWGRRNYPAETGSGSADGYLH